MLESLTKETLYEYPSFKVALFSILLSFILSSAIAFTYYLTNKEMAFSRNFFQAMILSAVVSCMVIMAVGNNVAAGFGIIGAIAIIRFRVNIKNPRNIIFIFSTLSVGVAAGVYGYSIALAGTVVFCFIAMLLHFSKFGETTISRESALQLTLDNQYDEGNLTNILNEYCDFIRLTNLNSTKTGTRLGYFIILKQGTDRNQLFVRLKEEEGLSNIRIERDDNLDKI
ncbi:MAG: hypothetical protein CMB80_23910 [Flammeovirgaceae bacterium]|nr:hypothetical protein [Flammeovirgaceae bacterium]MBR11086.1 hypothetical protein [Rickettsiales bacterium]|tara:strand:- start:5961 stop:6638 length:678 start_codon:yes stop_codon:yes gene_type:complete